MQLAHYQVWYPDALFSLNADDKLLLEFYEKSVLFTFLPGITFAVGSIEGEFEPHSDVQISYGSIINSKLPVWHFQRPILKKLYLDEVADSEGVRSICKRVSFS